EPVVEPPDDDPDDELDVCARAGTAAKVATRQAKAKSRRRSIARGQFSIARATAFSSGLPRVAERTAAKVAAPRGMGAAARQSVRRGGGAGATERGRLPVWGDGTGRS